MAKTAVKIALAGNPNSGKTTLFNALTGSSQYVGNWPGVTVEKKDGRLKKRPDVVIQDLPGIYSLSPYSQEEVIARSYLVEEKPDAILNIVDGTNIERNLYLTTQLAELGIPMLVAVNMIDIVRKNGDAIDLDKLSQELRCPVVGISALKGEGTTEAAEKALALAKEGKAAERPHVFTGSVEHALAHIEESIQHKVPARAIRWYAIKIFERDAKALAGVALEPELLDHVETHIAECEREMDDDAESIITNQRYARIKELVDLGVRKKPRKGSLSLSDKIDRVVTNRVLALPIFAAVIWLMYYIAVTTVGGWLTDWANDGVFGDGWFVYKTAGAPAFCSAEVNERNKALEAKGEEPETWEAVSGAFGDAEKIVADWEDAYAEAYGAAHDGAKPERGDDGLVVDEALAKTVSAHIAFDDEESGEIDEEATRDYGYADYLEAKEVPEPDPGDYGLWVPGIPALLESLFEKIGVSKGSFVHSLVFDAIVGGVGTVLGFVPQIIIVFLFLAFFEDCGYMARIAFIMDRIFRRFGLSGKSFIPILVGMGCGVPAVMATRTIESQRDRRMSIILTTYLPCGAKYAIIAMFTTAFFGGSSIAATSMYFLGIAVIVLGGIALKKSKAFAGDPAPFVMELPAYHMPTLRGILIHTWDRVKAYMIKAGTVIFLACAAIWLLMSFDWTFHMVDLEESMLHDIGAWLAWVFAPLGFGHWQGAVATVTSEIAKEQAVADLAMLAGNTGKVGAAKGIFDLFASFNGPRLASLTGLSFMLMNLFDPPCLVAIIAAFREMGSRKWGWFCVGFQTLAGYCIALVAYQLGAVFVYGQPFGFWTAVALAVVAAVLYFIFRRPPAPEPEPAGSGEAKKG